MRSKDRVHMALAHEEPDRPPISATFTPEAASMLRRHLQNEDEELGVLLGNDLIKATVGIECSFYLSEDPVYQCPFGATWQNVHNATGHYTDIIDGALMDDPDGAKLRAYQIPDPDAPAQYEQAKALIRRYGQEKFIVGSCQCSIFEAAHYIRGFENTLMDMAIDEDYANLLFDKMMRFPLRAGLNLIDAGVDMVWLGDDVSTQSNMLFSLDMWRKYFKPRYAALFEAFRRRRRDIVIAYHSCGNCEAVIPDLIDIGLDVLNPIQPLAMDPAMIKRKYGKHLTLFGAVDVQQLMPFGTVQEIRSRVKEYKRTLGSKGGFIISPAHHFQSDTRLESILAYYDEAKKPTDYDPALTKNW